MLQFKRPMLVIAGNTVGKSSVKGIKCVESIPKERFNTPKSFCAFYTAVKHSFGGISDAEFRIADRDLFRPFSYSANYKEVADWVYNGSLLSVFICVQDLDVDLFIKDVMGDDRLKDLAVIMFARAHSDMIEKSNERGDSTLFDDKWRESWASYERLELKFKLLITAANETQLITLTKVMPDEYLMDVLPRVVDDYSLIEAIK